MRKYFIDTNVIVYANDSRDREKQQVAVELIEELMKKGLGVISTQVLQEYAAAAIKKLKQNEYVVLHQLKLLGFLEVVDVIPALIMRSLEIYSAYKIDFWDSCIISAAEKAGCDVIYSEDLNAGQIYSGIELSNPFG